MKLYNLTRFQPLKTACPIVLAASISTQLSLAQETIPESAEESLQELGVESDFAQVTIIDLNDEGAFNNITSQVSTSPQASPLSDQQEALDIIGADAELTAVTNVDTLRNSEIQDSPSKILSQESNRYRVPNEFLNPSEATPPNQPTSDLGSVPAKFDPPEIDLILSPTSLGEELSLVNPSQTSQPAVTSDPTTAISEEITLASTNLTEEISQSISEELTNSEASPSDSPATTENNVNEDATPASESPEEALEEMKPQDEPAPVVELLNDENDSATALNPEPVSESLAQEGTTFQPSNSSFISRPANDPLGGLNPVSALGFDLIGLPSSTSNIPEPSTGLLLSLSILGTLCHRKR